MKLADVSFSPSGLRNLPINRKQNSQPADETTDPREIDKVLTEAAGMAGRWGLFRKFLSENLRV